MMSLGDDKVRCVTFFYGTDSICLGSIDNNNEQRRTQNKEKEVLYQAVKEAFDWITYPFRESKLLKQQSYLKQLGEIEGITLLATEQLSSYYCIIHKLFHK